MKLRWHLSGLVLGLLIPLLLLPVALVVFLGEREREAVEHGMEHTVRALATAFDATARDMISTLRALAASRDLSPGDLPDFREDVQNVPALSDGVWAMLTLVDSSGEEVLRVAGRDGNVELPPAAQSEHFAAVMASRQPVVSTLATVRTPDGDILLPVAVPVLRDGTVRFVLTAFCRASVLDRILEEQLLEPGWIVAIVDNANRIIARSQDGKAIVGQQAAPQFAAAISRADAGRFAGLRRGGVSSISYFLRSKQTGWTIVLSAPEEALLAPGRRLAWTIGIAGVLFLAAGLTVTTLLGRRIARAIASLGAPARALGRGEPLPALPPSRIAEIGELATEMENASTLLRQRQHERDVAEAGLAARADQQAEIAALGFEALRQADLDAFMAHVTERLAATLRIDISNVLELLPDGTLRIRVCFGWTPAAPDTCLAAPSGSHPAYVLSTGEAVVFDELAAEARFEPSPLLLQHGIVSGMSVIIHGTDKPFGILGAYSRARRRFTPDDVSFLQAAANVLSTAVARQTADQALRRSEERHRSVIELAQEIIWIQVAGRIVSANPYAHRAFGLEPPDGLVGQDLLALFHPDDRPSVQERTRSIIAVGQTAPTTEMRMLRPDGGVLLVEFQGMPITYEGSAAVLGIGHDVTERRRADDALRESERRFREFAEAASDFLWEVDADFRVTYMSHGEPELVRFIGQAVSELPLNTTDPDAMLGFTEDLQAHRPFRDFVYSWIGADLRMHHLRTSGRPIFDAQGTFLGYRGIGSDITDQIESEERLRQAQKMEAVGQLTGGIAHDFNNLLSVVIGNSELLLDRIDPQDKMSHQLISQLGQAGARGADLTGRLLAFSRRQPLKPRLVQLNELVRSLEPLLRRTLGENVEIRTRLADGLGTTLADASQIENALLNLAVNARDAMPGGGQLSIETKNVQLDDTYAASVVDLRAGPYVMLAVSDTGCGMAPEVRQRAFEPFFTTKETGKGTGLGLAMIYGFARQSGGHASIYSEVNLGTTVKLYLPRADAGDEAAAVSTEAAAMQAHGETILLVEDDEAVREMLALRLAVLGYKVIEARHGRAALETIRGGAVFDLILTDVVMPSGVDGWDLAQAVWRDTPAMPVVFMTGYTDNFILRRASEDQQIRVLSKPFRQSDLAAALRAALAGQPVSAGLSRPGIG